MQTSALSPSGRASVVGMTTSWLLGVGVASLLGQVAVLRELAVAAQGSELVSVVALGLWLLGTAAGTAWGRARPARDLAGVAVVVLVAGAASPAGVVAARLGPWALGALPGGDLPLERLGLVVALSVVPLSWLWGWAFQGAATRHVAGGGTLGRAYAVESAGGLVGGALSTGLVRWGVPGLAVSVVAALACALLVMVVTAAPSRKRVAGLVLAGAGVLAASGPVDRGMTALANPGVVASEDTPYGRVTVMLDRGRYAVLENGVLTWESEGAAAEEMAHLAMLAHPAPQEVLVLGGGVSGTVREVRKHRPARVDHVELNGAALALLRRVLPPWAWEGMEGPGVTTVVEDPRRFLERTGTYDVILVDMGEPVNGQTSRFYTREHFSRCAAHLRPGGVLAFRLPGAENLWTPPLTSRTSSIHRALAAVFPETLVVPGATTYLLASTGVLERDPDTLSRRLAERGVSTRAMVPPYIRYLLTNDRVARVEQALRETHAPENTDTRPSCFPFTLVMALSRLVPGLAWWDAQGFMTRWSDWVQQGWWVLVVAVLVVAARRRPVLARSLAVGVAACVGMVVEAVLIVAYQVSRGALYLDLGVLLAAFMGGLAVGALGMDRWARRWPRVPRLLESVALAGALSGVALLSSWVVGAGGGPGLGACVALLALAGAGVAATLAHAGRAGNPEEAARLVAPLYVADLVGGAVGAVAVSLLLLPGLGTAESAGLVSLLALVVALGL
jgi:spermidine synthase